MVNIGNNKCNFCKNNQQTLCGTLHNTKFYPGGFAQYLRVPEINIKFGAYILPDNVSFDEGTFIEPLACVVRGFRIMGFEKGKTVIILGSGMAGLLHIQLAKQKGAQKIFAADINPHRLELAEKFGADNTIDAKGNLPQKLKELNDGRAADKVLVCTGAEKAALTALECVDRGGTILFFAVPDPTTKIPIPITQFWRNEITIKTSYGAAPKDLDESLKILSQKKINVSDMITHRLSLREAAEGFRLVAEAGKSLKVIIEPNRN